MKSRSLPDDFPQSEENSFYFSVFKNAMVGQIIITEHLRLVSANNRMFQFFQLSPYDVKGFTYCSVFNCPERQSRNCESEQFKRCCIWNAVQDILIRNITIKSGVIPYSFKAGNRNRVKWFQMNGISISHLNEKYALLTFTDITSLKKQEDCLRKALALDLATGTLNKYSLMDSLQKLTDSCTSGGGFTICMIDFDNFKEVNDVYGHLMGDRVLETFSDIARKHIRKRDILGRYGGEEFIFVFPDSSEEMSLRILQRIQRELQKFFEADLKIPVTFSAGLIYVDNKEYEFPKSSDLIGSVDKMLYRAKTHGRNRAVCSKGEILFNATR